MAERKRSWRMSGLLIGGETSGVKDRPDPVWPDLTSATGPLYSSGNKPRTEVETANDPEKARRRWRCGVVVIGATCLRFDPGPHTQRFAAVVPSRTSFRCCTAGRFTHLRRPVIFGRRGVAWCRASRQPRCSICFGSSTDQVAPPLVAAFRPGPRLALGGRGIFHNPKGGRR